LRALHPQLAEEWHPEKNGQLHAEDVRPGSNKKVWWCCRMNSSHEWQSGIQNRVKGYGPCPICSGFVATAATSLRALHPQLAEEWHQEKNGNLTPNEVKPGSNKKVWWQCKTNPAHEWQAVISSRVRGNGCRICAGQAATSLTSLYTLRPELVEEWHPIKNGELTPHDVMPGSGRKVWWRCRVDPSHEWQMSINYRGRGHGCPLCLSLRALYPYLAEEWHPTKNGSLTPDDVKAGGEKKVWWQCRVDPSHEWQASIYNRINGSGCLACASKIVTPLTSLQALYPELAAEWHEEKNGAFTPKDILPGSNKKVWWQCRTDPSHVWEASVNHRVRGRGCPACNRGWTLPAMRGFVDSLKVHLPALTPAELYCIFLQSGLLTSSGRRKAFVKALATGRFPVDELVKFVSGEESLVNQFIDNPSQTLEQGRINGQGEQDLLPQKYDNPKDDEYAFLGRGLSNDADCETEANRIFPPVVETKAVLSSVGHLITLSSDEEAVEFFISSAVAKIWRHAFHDESAAAAQAEQVSDNAYAERTRKRFLDEYWQAKALRIPPGYAFQVDGVSTPPNLMQRLAAVRVRNRIRVGNWSGTGAGKTLSAILASRVVEAKLTIICCPNSVVEGWQQAILDSFPDSQIQVKSFTPRWNEGSDDALGFRERDHRYLVLNYEAFQQADSARHVRTLVEHEQIDFVIVDEIHYTKQRTVEDTTQRRKLIAALTVGATQQNPNLYVLGMSATPVINNLQEGKSLIELVTGVAYDDLDTHPTVSNCMALHQRLVQLGIRWMPEYRTGYEQREIAVDCSSRLNDIRALSVKGTPLSLELILTQARLPVIRQHIISKTLIYTHLIQGIDRLLWDALVEDGWKVGFYTGEDKTGLTGFLDGDIDVLIGSSAIGTGVDGLQQVCHRLIVNVLPWTAAEFEQLKGRIFRQGQQHPVTMILPLTYALVHGERWSWCESKMQRLSFKKSIADATVDGVVPEGHLRTPVQAYQDLMAWLERLEMEDIKVISRPRILVPLPVRDAAELEHRQRYYGTFSTMNRRWNQGYSGETHRCLQANPEEWMQYHTLYREQRKEWAVVPYEEMIRWCQQRSGKVIGDFGCGEALLAQAVSDRHTVYSIDHVAINEGVIVCDMAHVPLDDETLDVAIFSLSLMGVNFTEYLREAHRTLKLDGLLHIVEATERFADRNQFAKDLEQLGFAVIRVEDKWKFTYIQAIKVERSPGEQVVLHF